MAQKCVDEPDESFLVAIMKSSLPAPCKKYLADLSEDSMSHIDTCMTQNLVDCSQLSTRKNAKRIMHVNNERQVALRCSASYSWKEDPMLFQML